LSAPKKKDTQRTTAFFDDNFEVKKFLNLILENGDKFEKFLPFGADEEYRFSNSGLKIHLSSLIYDDELIHLVAYND